MFKTTICGGLIFALVLVSTLNASAQKTEIAPVGQSVAKSDLKSLLDAETVRLRAASESTPTTASASGDGLNPRRPRRNYYSRNKTIMWLGIASALSTLILVLTTNRSNTNGYVSIPDCRLGPC